MTDDRAPLSARGFLGRLPKQSPTTPSAGSEQDLLHDIFAGMRASDEFHDLDDASLTLVEELIRQPWSMSAQDREALAILVLASTIATRAGSTRLPLVFAPGSYFARVVDQLLKAAKLTVRRATLLKRAQKQVENISLDSILGVAGEFKPLIVANDCLYHQRFYLLEQECGQHFSNRLSAIPSPAAPGGAPPDSSVDLGHLDDGQRIAVDAAVKLPLTLIAGGPGTGKTTVIRSIVEMLLAQGIAGDRMAIAAPTGKAVNRIEESLGATATPISCQTLHRLLGYRGDGGFRYHEHNQLALDYLIVDEASMIDIEMMVAVLRALPAQARLVLLGDGNQLPAVQAGAIFSELVDADIECVRTLHVNHRLGRGDDAADGLAAAAQAAVGGQWRPSAHGNVTCFRHNQTGGEIAAGAPPLHNDEDGRQFLVHLLSLWTEPATDQRRWLAPYGVADGEIIARDRERLRSLWSWHSQRRVLTATRFGRFGSRQINRELHGLRYGDSAPRLCPLTPVIATRNDYRRRLFNGECGVIVSGHNGRLFATFPRGDAFTVLPLDSIYSSLDSAYAMTVHRSQGSEYDDIAMLLPEQDIPLLTRELIYTALTRAKRRCVFLGSTALLKKALRRTSERYTGLLDAIALNDPPPA